MASPLVQAHLPAPGFLGLNNEQQAAQNEERFATQLDNAVFDESGKIEARKGYEVLASGTPDTVDRVFMWRKDKDTNKLMSVGDASGTATLYEMTTTSTEYDTFTSRGTMADTNVKLVNVNGYLCVFELGQSPKVWDGTGTLANFAAATGTTSNPTGGIAASAFGRLFVVSQDGKTVLGSELQPDPKTTGINWDNWFIDTTGNAGGTAVDGWVYGRDFITGLGSINEYLVIFGNSMIMVFTDVNGSPVLVDSITGVGCVNQETIQHIGDDLVFMSHTGLRSLRRTIENETPQLNDVSAFVRTDVIDTIDDATANGVFDPEEGFYLLSDGGRAFCFDTKQELPGRAMRSSIWTLTPNSASFCACSGDLFLAIDDGVCKYSGYKDDTATYKFTYKSGWLNMNQNAEKILKKLNAVIYRGDSYTPKFSYAFDWDRNGEESAFGELIPVIVGSEWNVDEWGLAEWGGDVERVHSRYIQASGTGTWVRVGLEFIINGYEVGIHEMRLMAKMGKISHV